MKSIKSRLTLVSMIALVLFMILTAIALERAVVKRSLQAEEDRLQLLIYSLLAAVDRDESGLSIAVSDQRLFESSLMTPDSGLNALLYNETRDIIWQSRSMTLDFKDINPMKPGDWQFDSLDFKRQPYFRLAFALQWPDLRDQLQRYDVVIWQNASRHFDDLDRFRQTLWSWLIVTTLLLLAIMYFVMHWSLRPLRQVGFEIEAIESRKQSGFESSYPSEITPLTENLNILLNREKLQRQRYRNAMDDLAHSLKTPLAVLRGFSQHQQLQATEVKTLREQVDRMDQIVSYQLQKATSVGNGEILPIIDLVPLISKVLSALEKVYRDKLLQLQVDLAEKIPLRMDEGDCLEVFGNLLDNAFKYGRKRVVASSRKLETDEIQITIEDDGEGLKASEIEKILERGTRLDQVQEGQGIGLAVVADIIKTYNIDMAFARSELGGLQVNLILPAVAK